VAERRDEHPERIPVAAPRPRAIERPAGRKTPAAAASDAGLALIVVIAIFGVVGAAVGGMVDARAAGALVGGFLGVLAGFAGVYIRYRDL
jgi:hypothetical protein